MQNNVLKKGLGTGIILLFLCAGVLPCVSGKLVTDNIDDTDLYNSLAKVKDVYIGLIKDKLDELPGIYRFTCIKVFHIQFYNGHIETEILKDGYVVFTDHRKIGILTPDIVCAIFF
ncbi:Uncharacterised protein [uncultured archaeon]|nr:Uncharacterised protein [uncultured archaeon]